MVGELSGVISLDGQTVQVDEQQSHDPSLKRVPRVVSLKSQSPNILAKTTLEFGKHIINKHQETLFSQLDASTPRFSRILS